MTPLHFHFYRSNNTTRYVTKGSRIRAQWFQADPIGSCTVAGDQLKISGSIQEVTGTVVKIQGDHPEYPTRIHVFVKTDTGQEIVVNQIHIIDIIE